MTKKRSKAGIWITILAVGVIGGGGGWYLWQARSEAVARVGSQAAVARQIMTLVMDFRVEDDEIQIRRLRAMREIAARQHRQPDELRKELAAGLRAAEKLTSYVSEESSRRLWSDAGDLALSVDELGEAEKCYLQAGREEEKSIAAERWAADFEKLALVYHLQKRFADEGKIRDSISSNAKTKNGVDRTIRFAFGAVSMGQSMSGKVAVINELAWAEPRSGADSLEVLQLVDVLGQMELNLGQFDEAEKSFRRALALAERRFGPEDWWGVIILRHLEMAFYGRKNWAEAVAYAERALAMSEKVRGTEDYFTAMILRDLAQIHNAAAEFPEAEAASRRALDIDEKVLPNNHGYTGGDMYQLARAVASQSRLAEAERYYRGGAEILEKAYGPDSPIFVSCFEGLASTMSDTHPFEEFEPLLRRLITLDEKVFGANSARTGQARLSLGTILDKQGRHAEAVELLQRGKEAFKANASLPVERNSGYERPAVTDLILQSNDAREAKDFAKAENLLRKALDIEEKASSPNETTLATLESNLGVALQEDGQYTEAERRNRRALELRLKLFGPNNHLVANTAMNLALLYKLQGRPADGLPLARQAIEIYETTLGHDHVSLIVALNNTAAMLQDLHRSDEAEQMQRRSVSIAEKNYGPETEDTAIRLNYLAVILEQGQRFSDAEPILRRLLKLAIKDSHQAAAHPEMLRNVSGRYARCLQALGQNSAAIGARIEHLRRGEEVPDLGGGSSPVQKPAESIPERSKSPTGPGLLPSKTS